MKYDDVEKQAVARNLKAKGAVYRACADEETKSPREIKIQNITIQNITENMC